MSLVSLLLPVALLGWWFGARRRSQKAPWEPGVTGLALGFFLLIPGFWALGVIWNQDGGTVVEVIGTFSLGGAFYGIPTSVLLLIVTAILRGNDGRERRALLLRAHEGPEANTETDALLVESSG
jgi:hypothetical protein